MSYPISIETLMAEYRKVRFNGKTGSSVNEIHKCIALAIFFNIYTTLFVNIFFKINKSKYSLRKFIFEFLGCIFPLVVSLTYLSEYLFVIHDIFAVVTIAFSFWLNKGGPMQMLMENVRVKDDMLPCVSHFRGLINLYSVICILCADFTIFPERFLKTEFYGYSLMDSGVGLFVVTLALGSSHSRPRPAGRSVFFKHFIFLFIGIGRYFAVRSVDYQHQIFEYGVHWNFFITLAVIGIFNEFLFRFIKSTKNIFIFSIILLIFYEFALIVGLRDWIFGPSPRDSFIAANREGICSIAGYEVLYLWGVVIKSFLPKKGDLFEKYRRATTVYLITFLIILFINYFSYTYFPPSRRCVNFGYVLWVISIPLFYLSILIWYELHVLVWNIKMKSKINRIVPYILESVNFNGLLFFLLGNLLTGLINLSMYTFLISDCKSLAIITLYIFTCCSVSSLLYAKKWRIR